VKYGTDPNALNQTAQGPWTSGTHRVTLNNLQANTRYWFQVQSGQAQGTGTIAQSGAYPFKTIAPGQSALNITKQ
jgi:phosphodiesterase/alkaline phosphatase D-like protein